MATFRKDHMSAEWGPIMLQEHQAMQKNKSYESRRKFQFTLITGLWDTYGSIWKHHSSTLHDQIDITSLSNIDLNSKIKFYYDNRHNLLGVGDQD